MKRISFNQKIYKKECSFLSEFARKFSHSTERKTSTVEFIANRQDPQRHYKLKQWKTDPIESGAYRGLTVDPILSCKTSQEIWNFVIHRKDDQTAEDIHRAIRKCSSFNDYEVCWQLFEFAKSKFIVDANVYYHMIWILNHSNIYKNEDKVIQIYKQLMNEVETFKIKPNYQLITATFSFLTKYQQWNEAHHIWNKLQDSNSELLVSAQVWNSFIDLNIKQCLLQRSDNAVLLTHILTLLDEMCNQYEVKPNDITYGNVISAVSKLYKRNSKFERCHDVQVRSKVDFLAIGENLFKQCRDKCLHDPHDNVYATMIDLYGNAGNIEVCMKLLKVVIKKQLDKQHCPQRNQYLRGDKLLELAETGYVWKNDWNERTLRSCFGSTLKAIINNHEISFVDGWKLIDYIIKDLLLNKCELPMDVVTYGLLFHCIGAFGKENIDMKKLKKLYKQMLKQEIKPNALALNNFTVVGKTKYENDKKKADKFAKWVLKQFIKHKLAMPRVLQVKLNKMMVYHDDTIRNMVRRFDTI